MGKELPQGSRLGAYAIERLVLRTGLAEVYAARQVVPTERPCRLTVFNVDPDSEPWERFSREAAQLKALEHPGIAEIREVGKSEAGLPFMVHMLPEGEDLAARLRKGGALTTREAVALARQVAAALHAAHGIEVIHRDLTPENIFLVERAKNLKVADGEEPPFERVQVLGFGVSRMLEAALGGTMLVGEAEYMAPEQITGFAMEVGPAADQYALALIVYQALTASRPFRGDSVGATLLQVVRSVPEPLRALRPDIPAHVEVAVMRALSRDRLARYPSLAAFIEALQGEDAAPAGLAELTDAWLRPSARADAARQRALTVSGAAPSFQSVALGLSSGGGGGGVPEIVEDSATVPNTMEEVMRLAVPPERIEVLESTAPVTTESGARPAGAMPRQHPLPGVANQAARALAQAIKAGPEVVDNTARDAVAPPAAPPPPAAEPPLDISVDPNGEVALKSELKEPTDRVPAARKPVSLETPATQPGAGQRLLWAALGLLLGLLLGYLLRGQLG
jgi:serine/threonine-protein kinase